MDIDLIRESAWTSVILGTRNVQFEFLALQLFLVSLRNRVQAKEISIPDCIHELKTFYAKFSRLPMAEMDFNKIGRPEQAMTSRLLDVNETARRIRAGQSLMLAGEEQLLAALPPGNWIGGTTSYFMASEGGCQCKDRVFVTEFPGEFQPATQRYETSELPGLYRDAGERSVSLVILPANSPAHVEFALHAPGYAGFALHPLAGWIAGVDLDQPGSAAPKVFCGGPEPRKDGAAVMRIKVPADRLAQIKIINLFQPGQGDAICFPTTGFAATMAVVNGKESNLAEYLHRIKADTRLPLVANYCGAMVNVSLKSVDPQSGRVEFFAPVVAGIEYRLATPLPDYVSEFEARLEESSPENMLFSCNCFLNYLHSKLAGRRTGAFVGPVTYGEIAFQLLNQTLVYVEIVRVASPEPPPAGTEPNASRLELLAAHEEIRASELRFRALSESAPLGIFLTDAAGRVIYESPACLKLGWVSAEDVPGAWRRNVHPNDVPGLTAAIAACERGDRDLCHEFRFVGPDGTIRWVHSQTSSVRGETGEITGRIGTVQDITERKEAEVRLERLNLELIRASREAGIAEFVNGVLHNVKNAINSISVSTGVISEQLKQSTSSSLTKVTGLVREHAADLGRFITEDSRGKHLPDFLEKLDAQLAAERVVLLEELHSLETKVEHIKEVVVMQQDAAKKGGGSEKVRPVDLMEDSLLINAESLARHNIQVVREHDANLPEITVEKHRVLQILVNFIRNAKHACQASDRPDRKLVLKVAKGEASVSFAVMDNGMGILPENLDKLFVHGFTTKKDGHGFGLHSAALAARQLGGVIRAHSDGFGKGATFTLELPICRPAAQEPESD
jgi:PAS domain S-box-containing protein